MRDGKPTKNRLLIEAFKLFAHKPYDRVTFADLEEVTGLSRGAILYHIKTKENLFLKLIHVNYYSLKKAPPSLDGDASFI